MDRFSLEILERTVLLAIEAMPPDENPRIVDCAVTILDYVASPQLVADTAVHAAVLELAEIARANYQFLISARLAPIARQLGGTGRNSSVA